MQHDSSEEMEQQASAEQAKHNFSIIIAEYIRLGRAQLANVQHFTNSTESDPKSANKSSEQLLLVSNCRLKSLTMNL